MAHPAAGDAGHAAVYWYRMPHWFAQLTNTLLFDTAVTFVAGLLFALLVRRFHQSALIGYVIAGLVIGPYGLRLVPDETHIRFLAEVGVVFLMFALGVQLSFHQLLQVRTTAIFGGLAQIIIMIVLGVLLGRWFGFSPATSLVLGYALALSSSVVLVRLLGEADEFHTAFGRIALGISVMQDLMAVVLISTLPFLTQSSSGEFRVLAFNLGKAVLFVVWAIVLARWVAPIILRWASATGSREIFLPTVAVLSLGGAMVSGVFGFSYALGAFLAGLVISESLFSQAVLAEVIPLRDIFGMLFFVSLGMLVNPFAVFQAGVAVGILLFAAVVIKGLLIFALLLCFRHHPYTALIAGVSLAQVGEFSFIIAREAQGAGVISAGVYGIILAVAIISIALTPVLLPLVRWLYQFFRKARQGQPGTPEAFAEIAGRYDEGVNAVLLCGYGRVGRTIAQALDAFRIPFLVVDIDRHAVETLQRRGIRAVYGDAANIRLLERIGAQHFQLAVIAVGEYHAARTILQHLHRVSPAMQLLLRSHTDRETAEYLAMGADGVVHVEVEASLAFVAEVLVTADVDSEIVTAYLDDIRLGYYEGLRPPPREE
ncbi:MAG TPA: cation:proton antiporter [Armatimonadota bacterium]|jgi:CPA2 family monovalent cation:H+ antiporter-2